MSIVRIICPFSDRFLMRLFSFQKFQLQLAVLACVWGSLCCLPIDPTETPLVRTVRDEREVHADGTYHFVYERSDGQFREESAKWITPATGNRMLEVSGSYGFVGPDGITYRTFYNSGRLGYTANAKTAQTPGDQDPPKVNGRRGRKFESRFPSTTLQPSTVEEETHDTAAVLTTQPPSVVQSTNEGEVQEIPSESPEDNDTPVSESEGESESLGKEESSSEEKESSTEEEAVSSTTILPSAVGMEPEETEDKDETGEEVMNSTSPTDEDQTHATPAQSPENEDAKGSVSPSDIGGIMLVKEEVPSTTSLPSAVDVAAVEEEGLKEATQKKALRSMNLASAPSAADSTEKKQNVAPETIDTGVVIESTTLESEGMSIPETTHINAPTSTEDSSVAEEESQTMAPEDPVPITEMVSNSMAEEKDRQEKELADLVPSTTLRTTATLMRLEEIVDQMNEDQQSSSEDATSATMSKNAGNSAAEEDDSNASEDQRPSTSLTPNTNESQTVVDDEQASENQSIKDMEEFHPHTLPQDAMDVVKEEIKMDEQKQTTNEQTTIALMDEVVSSTLPSMEVDHAL